MLLLEHMPQISLLFVKLGTKGKRIAISVKQRSISVLLTLVIIVTQPGLYFKGSEADP